MNSQKQKEEQVDMEVPVGKPLIPYYFLIDIDNKIKYIAYYQQTTIQLKIHLFNLNDCTDRDIIIHTTGSNKLGILTPFKILLTETLYAAKLDCGRRNIVINERIYKWRPIIYEDYEDLQTDAIYKYNKEK